jgi:hypothetical protein
MRLWNHAGALAFSALIFAGCLDDPNSSGATDLGGVSDPFDVAVDRNTDTEFDAVTDVVADPEVRRDPSPDARSGCEDGPGISDDPSDPERARFALAMFHFNVGYVTGGLEYFDEEGRTMPFLGLPIDEAGTTPGSRITSSRRRSGRS